MIKNKRINNILRASCIKTHPVPISLKPSYLFFGSSEETGNFGKAFLIRFSNSFSVLTSGGSCGISVQFPTGRQGCLDICFCRFGVRRRYVFSTIGSGLRKQSLPKTFGIS